ncbi:MAG: hypothetical protein GXP19_03240 [Gammaproteobacteria bacterium]|nr:hypothetical protein [Gammaproteobacteria bacterium]
MSTVSLGMVKRILAVFFIQISLTAVAIAGPGHVSANFGVNFGVNKGGKFMAFFDSNSDKIVTMDELKDASKKRFTKMDADGDNIVSADEFKIYVGKRRQERRQKGFQMADSDSDGQVSKEEYINHKKQKAERRFQQMDANSDGLVSREEFSAVTPWRYDGRHDGRHVGKSGVGKPGRHGGGARFFSRLDGNGDGYVTRDESVIAWSNWFKRIDANSDQVVIEEEVQQYRNNKRIP